MKISRLLQVVFVGGNVLVAVPGLAASQPSVGSSAPISLCGGEKSEKTDKTSKGDNKKDEKKDDKADSKAPATT
jgi:hypothetical protein